MQDLSTIYQRAVAFLSTTRQRVDSFLVHRSEAAKAFGRRSFVALSADKRTEIFLKTFRPTGYDPLRGTLHGEIVLINEDGQTRFNPGDAYNNYLKRNLTGFAAFVGLRTDLDEEGQKTGQTRKNLGLEFVGWKSSRPVWLKVILALIWFIPRSLASILIKLPINIAKIVTELLPHYLLAISAGVLGHITSFFLEQLRSSFTKTYDGDEEKVSATSQQSPSRKVVNALVRLLLVFPFVLLVAAIAAVIAAVSAMWYYVGRAVTSPVDSAHEDWVNWKESNPAHPKLSFAIRLFFTGLRVLTTATVYGLIAAFALPALAGLLGPLVPAVLLPVTHAFTLASAAVLQSLSVVIPAISIMPTTTIIPMLLGMVVGAAVAIFGAIIKHWTSPSPTRKHNKFTAQPEDHGQPPMQPTDLLAPDHPAPTPVAKVVFRIHTDTGMIVPNDCTMPGPYHHDTFNANAIVPNIYFERGNQTLHRIEGDVGASSTLIPIIGVKAARLDELLKLRFKGEAISERAEIAHAIIVKETSARVSAPTLLAAADNHARPPAVSIELNVRGGDVLPGEILQGQPYNLPYSTIKPNASGVFGIFVDPITWIIFAKPGFANSLIPIQNVTVDHLNALLNLLNPLDRLRELRTLSPELTAVTAMPSESDLESNPVPLSQTSDLSLRHHSLAKGTTVMFNMNNETKQLGLGWADPATHDIFSLYTIDALRVRVDGQGRICKHDTCSGNHVQAMSVAELVVRLRTQALSARADNVSSSALFAAGMHGTQAASAAISAADAAMPEPLVSAADGPFASAAL